jgi:hypothetical protein
VRFRFRADERHTDCNGHNDIQLCVYVQGID